MKIIQAIKNNKILILDFLFICLVFVLSFPNFEPDFSTGLDAPFRWGYNYLWIHDYDTLKNLIYPYGPLFVLKGPVVLGNNFTIFLFFFTFIKLLFLRGLLFLGKKHYSRVSYLAVFLLSYFLSIDFLFIGIVVVSALFYLENRNIIFYSFAVLFSLIGLYVKSSIGINCMSVVFVLWILLFVHKIKQKEVKILIVLTIIITSIINLIVGGSIFYIFGYLERVLLYSSVYSSAMALFPENNWVLLGVFIFSIILTPFIVKQKKTTQSYLLLIIPLYGIWKHAMIRESVVYYTQLLDFIILFWGIIILTSSSFSKKIYYAVPLLGILAIYVNAKTLDNKFPFKKNTSGISNLKPLLFSFNSHVEGFYKNSLTNVSVNEIAQKVRKKIDNKTIDIYPWDFSYIPANEFNWKPRKTFQSIGFSGQIDKINSQSFTRENGPEFLLFQAKKDTFGGFLGSIDYRYLLNVEPQTNFQLFKNYNIVHVNKKFTLFKKNNTDNFKHPVQQKIDKKTWNEWISCPKTKNGILKARVFIQQNLLGKFIQLLYKDEAYYIDYYLISGKTLTYRFIPSIAENGIWVNPIITSFQKETAHEQVIKIRFHTNSDFRVKEEINIKWEFYEKQNLNTENTILFHYEK